MSENLIEQGYVTVEEMQRRTRLSDAALHQAILDLESVGLVHVVRGCNRTDIVGDPLLVRRTK
jgi:hypothetical protein